MRCATLASAGLGAGTALALTLVALPAVAQAPPEVGGLTLGAGSVLSWSPAVGANDYNVYRGKLSGVASVGAECLGDEIATTSFAAPQNPPTGEGYYYLVTAESNIGGEGSAGTDSLGGAHILLGRCDAVMRHHLLLRFGYGEDEWSRSRLASLGAAGYIDEQLAPETIDESSNTALSSRLAPITPPDTIEKMTAHDVFRAVYARRQLEQQAVQFWTNHFNTDYGTIHGFFTGKATTAAGENALVTEVLYREEERFRDLAFNGTFRDIVAASAYSPAMILYLDTYLNVVGRPNENYARELLELHTFGVDNGYTQTDIEQLARVLTGWNVCKKDDLVKDDPLAACIPTANEVTTPGTYVANFRPNRHDNGAKTLFQGTTYQVTIGPSSNASQAVAELDQALDAIAAHPSTRQFLSKKLIQWFVSETPTLAMQSAVEAAWTTSGGTLREVLRAVLELPEARDPSLVGAKIKTPLEHVASALRATRGLTDSTSTAVRSYLILMVHVPHQNPVPTGYPETGFDWVDTTGILVRQNFGVDVTSKTGAGFGTDLIGLMAANGLTSASPPGSIIDFWADRLFGSALTAAERQEAITFLTTSDTGSPAAVTNAKIRETVGFLLGYPQFQEQ